MRAATPSRCYATCLDFRRTLQDQKARGKEPILSGTFMGIEVDFLDTERDLGVILEVFSHMPKKRAGLR